MLPVPADKFWISLNLDLEFQIFSQSNFLAGGLHWGQEYITSLCRMEEIMTISRHIHRDLRQAYSSFINGLLLERAASDCSREGGINTE